LQLDNALLHKIARPRFDLNELIDDRTGVDPAEDSNARSDASHGLFSIFDMS